MKRINEIKIVRFFGTKRLLDIHIGILSLHIWVRLLAAYHNFFYIVYIQIRKVFHVSVCYHIQPSDYPRFQFIFELFSLRYDNGKAAAEIISKKVNEYMKKEDSKKEEATKILQEYLPDDKQELLSSIL